MPGIRDQKFEDKRSLWPFLKRIFSYSLRFRGWTAGLIVFVFLVAIVDALLPLIWSRFLDDWVKPMVLEHKAALSENREAILDVKGLINFGIIYAVMTITTAVTVFAFIVFAGKIQEHVIYNLRKDMFNKLQKLSFSFYDRSAIGWLLSRISSDADRVSELVSWGFIELVWGIVMIIGCLSIMFYINWVLAIIVLISIPILLILGIKIRLLILKYSREARRLNSEITQTFNEHINGVEVNKATAQEYRVAEKFGDLSLKMRRSSYRASYYTAMFTPVVIGVGSIAGAAVIFFGGNMVIEQQLGITIGILAAFFIYARNIFEPIFDITRFYAQAQGSLSAGERIFSLIDEEIEIKDMPGMLPFEELQGSIEFEQVGFQYVADKHILKDFNLKIKAGESIALVGPTGEGKSTIISLICRFYEPTSGCIKIDGIDYRERQLHSFRNQLGIILQTPYLFSGTIRDNLRYGDLNATDEQIKDALRLIGSDEMCERLDEEIGEEGGNLSIGEKQLISFTRAILKDPRILILDEATSSVDSITESKVQKGIMRLIKDRTSIIIAHRLSTIRHADRIIVIKGGAIEEQGSHDDLIKLKGHYYELYKRQKSDELISSQLVS